MITILLSWPLFCKMSFTNHCVCVKKKISFFNKVSYINKMKKNSPEIIAKIGNICKIYNEIFAEE